MYIPRACQLPQHHHPILPVALSLGSFKPGISLQGTGQIFPFVYIIPLPVLLYLCQPFMQHYKLFCQVWVQININLTPCMCSPLQTLELGLGVL